MTPCRTKISEWLTYWNNAATAGNCCHCGNLSSRRRLAPALPHSQALRRPCRCMIVSPL
jgi:hypothetical protein